MVRCCLVLWFVFCCMHAAADDEDRRDESISVDSIAHIKIRTINGVSDTDTVYTKVYTEETTAGSETKEVVFETTSVPGAVAKILFTIPLQMFFIESNSRLMNDN